MKKTIIIEEECPKCDGTGLYSGMGEGEGSAVVCWTCKGTGLHVFKYTYMDFTKRKINKGIRRVFELNPGYKIGENNTYKLEDFGGMSYEDWLSGKKFELGSENRMCTCPAAWCQAANKKMPNWKECPSPTLGGYFSKCEHFKNKHECWKRYDKEQKG